MNYNLVFLTGIALRIKMMSVTARSRIDPGITGVFIFKGKTAAGTSGWRCTRMAVNIITTNIEEAAVIRILNFFLDKYLLNKMVVRKTMPTKISEMMPSQ